MSICQATGKTRHETKDAAMGQARSLQQCKGHRDGLGAYRCDGCGGWHVGNSYQHAPWKPTGRRQRRRER